MSLVDSLTVRPATLDDLDALTTFSAAMALETEQRILDRARLRLGTRAVLEQPERGQFYVADVRPKPRADRITVGQLLITYEWSDWRNWNLWWFQSVYVEAGWRAKGVFRGLYDHVVAAAVREGVVGLRLYVEEDNHTAQEVYRRRGMNRTSYRVFEREL